jgi:apolipoprotein N-acyltransferase
MTLNSEKTSRIFWSIAGGVALTSAFDNIGFGFMAWIAIAFLLLGLRNASVRQAGYLGLLAGFVHYVTLLYWLVPTMHTYGPLPVWLSIGALLLLAFYMALYFALFSISVAAAVKRPVFLILAVPVFWVSLEYMKTILFSGFPWGLIGYSQYRYLHLIQIADIFGVYGVSFFLAAVNAALFVGLLHAGGLDWRNQTVSRVSAVFSVIFLVVIFAFTAGYGRYKIIETDKAMAVSESLRVSVVQGNIEQSLKWDENYVSETVEKYISLSEEAMPFGPALIVWPETAAPFYFLQDNRLTTRVLEGMQGMNSWFLVGSPSFEYNRDADEMSFFNSAYLVDPEARAAGVYDKVHLVPFGEYVPLGNWLTFIDRMVQSAGDFKPGISGKTLSMPNADLAVQICYEIIFPRLSAKMVGNGANLIINITNDAWFGKTAGPHQHFSMTVFRSVENRRGLARSANTGISAFVDPVGRITGRTELFETTTLSRSVPLMTGYTFYTKYTDLLPLVSLGMALLLLVMAEVRRKKENARR